MMRELFDHGPVVVGFEVGLGFSAYSHGIFRAEANLNIEHMAVAAYPTIGHSFPPKKGTLLMEKSSKSWGSHYLSLAASTKASGLQQTKALPAAKQPKSAGKDQKIEDPA